MNSKGLDRQAPHRGDDFPLTNLTAKRARPWLLKIRPFSGVSGRYATALFELARDEKSIDAVKADLDRFDAMLADSADLKRLVRSPVFAAEAQSKALAAVLDKAGISGISANFLKVLTANRRLFAVRDMIRAFRKLVARYKGEVTAEVTVAEPLATSISMHLKQPSRASPAASRSISTSRSIRRSSAASWSSSLPHGRQFASHQTQLD